MIHISIYNVLSAEMSTLWYKDRDFSYENYDLLIATYHKIMMKEQKQLKQISPHVYFCNTKIIIIIAQ